MKKLVLGFGILFFSIPLLSACGNDSTKSSSSSTSSTTQTTQKDSKTEDSLQTEKTEIKL